MITIIFFCFVINYILTYLYFLYYILLVMRNQTCKFLINYSMEISQD